LPDPCARSRNRRHNLSGQPARRVFADIKPSGQGVTDHFDLPSIGLRPILVRRVSVHDTPSSGTSSARFEDVACNTLKLSIAAHFARARRFRGHRHAQADDQGVLGGCAMAKGRKVPPCTPWLPQKAISVLLCHVTRCLSVVNRHSQSGPAGHGSRFRLMFANLDQVLRPRAGAWCGQDCPECGRIDRQTRITPAQWTAVFSVRRTDLVLPLSLGGSVQHHAHDGAPVDRWIARKDGLDPWYRLTGHPSASWKVWRGHVTHHPGRPPILISFKLAG